MDSNLNISGGRSRQNHSRYASSAIHSTQNGPKDKEETLLFQQHLSLLRRPASQHALREVETTPIFTMPVVKHVSRFPSQSALEPVPQYGLLGGLTDILQDQERGKKSNDDSSSDPRIFFNVTAPSSTFICGSQGSGKSHTLSCLLENCLSSSVAGKLPKPLSGIVFHYDTFISDDGGSPCEAAFLSSNPKIKVRVLCSPTNIRTIQVSRTYICFVVTVD